MNRTPPMGAMRKLPIALAILLASVTAAAPQNPPPSLPPLSCYCNPTNVQAAAQATLITTLSGITVGATPVAGATNGYVLYNNAGTLGQIQTTGTGLNVLNTSPTLVTPNIGSATAATVNGLTITTTTGVLTITAAKTATFSNTLSFSGTDSSAVNVGTGGTIGGTGYAVTGQIPGTATNDNAAAGDVGEYMESSVLVGSATSVSNATAKTITSLNLTAGDWDVSGNIHYLGATTTTFTQVICDLSSANNTLQNSDPQTFNQLGLAGIVASGTSGTPVAVQCPTFRVSLASAATEYLIAFSQFGTSTMTAFGSIRARRVR